MSVIDICLVPNSPAGSDSRLLVSIEGGADVRLIKAWAPMVLAPARVSCALDEGEEDDPLGSSSGASRVLCDVERNAGGMYWA